MRPYYVLMKLPGSARLEYLLLTSFTPPGRDNMIAWMATKCSFPDYGETMVFTLPKEKLIYGPSQVEAMIHQNTDISRQLTLRDSSAAHMLFAESRSLLPIENSFLYVVPLYLRRPRAFPCLSSSSHRRRRQQSYDGRHARHRTRRSILGPGKQRRGHRLRRAKQKARPTQIGPRSSERRLRPCEEGVAAGNWGEFGNAMGALDHQLSASPN